jgi:hypothetical protein
MQIVHMTKFVIGIAFFLLAIGLFVWTRRERGFGQYRQAALLGLVAAVIFGAMGLGVGG